MKRLTIVKLILIIKKTCAAAGFISNIEIIMFWLKPIKDFL